MTMPSGTRLAFAGLVATAVVEAVHVAHTHTPDLNAVAAATPGTQTAGDLRRGQLATLVTAAGVGAALSFAAGHPGPLLAALGAAAAVLAVYEWQLRKGA